MNKFILIAVVCLFASCGPSAERIKEDARIKQLQKTGDSLRFNTDSIINSW